MRESKDAIAFRVGMSRESADPLRVQCSARRIATHLVHFRGRGVLTAKTKVSFLPNGEVGAADWREKEKIAQRRVDEAAIPEVRRRLSSSLRKEWVYFITVKLMF